MGHGHQRQPAAHQPRAAAPPAGRPGPRPARWSARPAAAPRAPWPAPGRWPRAAARRPTARGGRPAARCATPTSLQQRLAPRRGPRPRGCRRTNSGPSITLSSTRPVREQVPALEHEAHPPAQRQHRRAERCRRDRRWSTVTSPTLTVPASACSNPSRQRRSVVLPVPDAPITASAWPGSTRQRHVVEQHAVRRSSCTGPRPSACASARHARGPRRRSSRRASRDSG